MKYDQDIKRQPTVSLFIVTGLMIFGAFHFYFEREYHPAFWLLSLAVALGAFTAFRDYWKVQHPKNYYYVLDQMGVSSLLSGNLHKAYRDAIYHGSLYDCRHFILKLCNGRPEEYLIINFMIPETHRYAEAMGDSLIKIPQSDPRYNKEKEYLELAGFYFQKNPTIINPYRP